MGYKLLCVYPSGPYYSGPYYIAPVGLKGNETYAKFFMVMVLAMP
jgi:hypothetical protein